MPWITQMIGFAVLFIGIVVALWLSFWILLLLLAVGVVFVIWTHLKAFLLKKGILNPTPGVPNGIIIEHEEETPTTIQIEGDYKRVDSE